MFVGAAGQSCNRSSPLCRFLDDCLPQRNLIVEQWTRELSAEQDRPLQVLDGVNAKWLGSAADLRIGLDLGADPGYWNLVSFLPAEHYRALMAAAGFTTMPPISPHGGDVDPLLQHWRRTSRPTQIDEQQRAALGLCLDAAELDSLGHRWGPTRQPDYRRSFFVAVHEDDPDHTSQRRHEPALIDAFTDLWDLYLRQGRDQLHTEGGTVLTSPELAAGFATADLITDQTLIEIKTAAQPETLLDKALNQILGYVLCDRDDEFRLHTVCLYLSRQAKSLTVSLEDILRTATPGPTPQWQSLRTQFQEALGDDLHRAAENARPAQPGNPQRTYGSPVVRPSQEAGD
ncbi:hypothetical protein [Saccharopolyspora shandongensis]|uniref:hypothetical protein n=1 Tax=Saccharopolyspora shandongensis TaxID=418495 RepID=UPI00115FAD5F|nr:hypothetical protein [Saccharopolyspora shandongensis]